MRHWRVLRALPIPVTQRLTTCIQSSPLLFHLEIGLGIGTVNCPTAYKWNTQSGPHFYRKSTVAKCDMLNLWCNIGIHHLSWSTLRPIHLQYLTMQHMLYIHPNYDNIILHNTPGSSIQIWNNQHDKKQASKKLDAHVYKSKGVWCVTVSIRCG